MKVHSSRSRAGHAATIGVVSLALFVVGSPLAVAKRSAEHSKRSIPVAEMRTVDQKVTAPGPAFEAQWFQFKGAAASKAAPGATPMFGDDHIFARFSTITGSPRLVFGDLGLAPVAGKMGDRALAFLSQNEHVFGVDTSKLSLVRAMEGATKPIHFYYEQRHQSLPVFGAEVAVHMDRDGRVWAINNTFVPVTVSNLTPEVTADGAIATAAEKLGVDVSDLVTTHVPAPELGIWPTADGGALAWRTVVDVRGIGVYEVIVDAATGRALEPAVSRDCYATGTGKVFQPGPVVTLANDSLTDATSAGTLEPAYISVTLNNLNDSPNTALVGTYAQVPSDQTGGRTTNASLDFSALRRSLTPASAQFNQENPYWAIDYAQSVFQSLGYTPANSNAVMNYSLQYYGHQAPHSPTADNSHFSGDNRSGAGTGHLCFGTGGVDDAEDQEIVWHEFGHAMLWNQRPGTSQNQTSEGVGEGTGDVLAGILSKTIPGGSSYYVTVGEWDATSYNAGGTPHPNLRKLDNPTLWASRPSAVHSAGEVWSHPVFDYNNQVGTLAGLDVQLQAQFLYDLSPTQVECAAAFLTADTMLNNGSTSGQINNAFRERGTIAGTVVPVVHTPGITTPGTGTAFLKNSATPGAADYTVSFGTAAMTEIVGDWDGDGDDTIGAYSPTGGGFFLRNTNTPGTADVTLSFGAGGADYVPVVGDWDGNGTDTIGIYNTTNGAFFLRNSNTPGAADVTLFFGPGGAGILPVVGDWDGDGDDTVGIFVQASGTFFLKNTNASGPADLAFGYGSGGSNWYPTSGDWNADNVHSIGIYDANTGNFFLRNTNTPGPADYTFGLGGGGARPLSGDYNGGHH